MLAAVAFAVFRYRAREGRQPSRRSEAPVVESVYAIALVAVVAFLVHETFTTSKRVDARAGRPALVINVTASDWRWRFDYPAQRITSLQHGTQPTRLVVPIEFRLTSLDVIHAFWVPDQRFQRDALPSRTTRFDLVFDHPGLEDSGRCNEYCGLGHGDMRFAVNALPGPQFDAWARAHRGQTL